VTNDECSRNRFPEKLENMTIYNSIQLFKSTYTPMSEAISLGFWGFGVFGVFGQFHFSRQDVLEVISTDDFFSFF